MPDIKYKYNMDQRVTTPFGEPGIITMLGYDGGGVLYYTKTKTGSDWFKESELMEAGMGVLNE